MLVDSEPISNGVLAEMLTEEGLQTSREQAKATHQGQRLEEVLASVESRLGHALPGDWLERYQRRRDDAFASELEAIGGVRDLIEAVLGAGDAICVASQGSLEKTSRSLALTGLDDLFSERARFSADEVPRGKPDPDLFLHAAAAMGFEPSRCVVVEDTPSGVTAGIRAGMRVLGFAGGTDATALLAAGAATTTRSHRDTLATLLPPGIRGSGGLTAS